MKKLESHLKIKRPPNTSAGRHAISESLKDVFSKDGIIRGSRGLLRLNQKGGIDCQSCAWPDPDHRTINEFCESGAKAFADEAMTTTIGREFFAKYSVRELNERDEYWLNKQGRLAEPLILRDGSEHYEPIDWQDAFDLIAAELNTHRAERRMKPRFSINFSFVNLVQTICLIARTCATNRQASRLPSRSVLEKRASGSKISKPQTWS
jgi:anaerobic selenocysteine-containing dehydrogenase